MTLRTYLAAGALALLAATGCGDDEHSHDDAGTGHEEHGDAGETCPHAGLTAECDVELDAIGATASDDADVTVEVTGATPADPMAGEGESNMLMLQITDAAGDPVTGATLDSVFTMEHGGHASCGMPRLLEMEDGMYQLLGLTYPHGGTWHHVLVVGESEIDLEICVMNAPDAEGGEHGG